MALAPLARLLLLVALAPGGAFRALTTLASKPATPPASAASAPVAPPAVVPSMPVSTEPPASSVAELRKATSYLRNEACVVDEALQFATAAHEGQLRKSGEPFIIHPIETACILADLRMDCDTVVAGLLHDVVEDTPVTVDQIRERFGPSVATIVAGVTDEASASQAHNRQELLLAFAADWRVVVVKLADRLHNMRTLQHMPRVKQQRKAQETMSLYVPLARKMGVHQLEHELAVTSTRYLFPRFAPRLQTPLANMLARSTDTGPHRLSTDMEEALHGHRRAWMAHQMDVACNF